MRSHHATSMSPEFPKRVQSPPRATSLTANHTYACADCGRIYSRQDSLKRHARGHRERNWHSCEICLVAFARGDLLARHIKIHTQADDIGLSYDPKHMRRRLRCHTACKSCKKTRTKCDGFHPCAACTSSQRDCQYLPHTLRTSRAPHFTDPRTDSQLKKDDDTRNAVMDQVDLTSPGDSEQMPEDHAEEFSQGAQGLGREQEPHSTAMVIESTNSIFTDKHYLLDASQPLDVPDSEFGVGEGSTHNNLDLTWDLSLTTAHPLFQEDSHFKQPMSVDFSDANGQNMEFSVLLGDPKVTVQDEDESQLTTNRERLALRCSDSFDFQGEIFGDGHWSVIKEANIRDLSRDFLPRPPKSTTQFRAVDEMVTYTMNLDSVLYKSGSRDACWRSMSIRISDAFVLETDQETGGPSNCAHSLHRCVQLFMEHFSPLWPLISPQDFDPDSLHPLLYLTCVSIGAMYGARQSLLGTMIHERIRDVLTSPLFEFERSDHDLISLAQARLLTQVLALYLGQLRGFSYAQQLGGSLAVQARRMNLLNASQPPKSSSGQAWTAPEKETLAEWTSQEVRRRLAFGILRAEAYTSLLLNTKPLVTAEDIGLTFPCPDAVWGIARTSIEPQTFAPSTTHLSFALLFWTVMDKDEVIPRLEPREHELLLFGLQESVWRFSHDPDLFLQILGSGEIVPAGQETDSIGDQLTFGQSSRFERNDRELQDLHTSRHRAMKALKEERVSLFKALEKWKQTFTASYTQLHRTKDRTAVLSSLLLYHISCLRLTTPLKDLHHISCRRVDKCSIEKNMIIRVQNWTKTRNARLAVYYACKICSLISLESMRTFDRARCNFLAFAGLHHAAVVLWTYAGSHEYNTEFVLDLPGAAGSIQVRRDQTAALLGSIVGLYRIVSSARWTYFSMAARELSKCEFPVHWD